MANKDNPLTSEQLVQGDDEVQHASNSSIIAKAFKDLAAERIWVASDKAKAPRDASGRYFDKWSEPTTILMTLAEALVTSKKYNLPNVGIIFPATGIVCGGNRLIAIDIDEIDGYRKFRPPKDDKPAVPAITFDPVAEASQVLAKVPLVSQLPPTVWEASQSCTGMHGFVWLPEDQASAYWGARHAKLAGCDHADTFAAGRKAQHLIVTGKLLGPHTSIATLASIEPLVVILRPAGDPSVPVELSIPDNGIPCDLTTLSSLSEDQQHLVAGTGDLNRSNTMHGFLIALIDAGMPSENILASLVHNSATAAYLLDHRNQDPIKALEFGRYEIGRAYAKSQTGMRARLKGFNLKWADGTPVAVHVAEVTDGSERQALRLVSAAELMRKAGPISWLIQDYFEADTVSQIFGSPGSYKSFIALGIAVAVASGLPWHDHIVKRQGPVVYVCGEGHNGLSRRLAALCQERGIDPDALPLAFSNAAVGLSNEENAANLKSAIDALSQPPVLIVIDTLARNFGAADENSTADMNAFITNIDKLRGRATVLVVHHSGHTSTERERGSSALRGAIDANYRVEFDDSLHVVHVTPLKMKDAELPPTLHLTPRVVELPVKDEAGQLVTSVVMECGEDQRAIRIEAFYKEHKCLAAGNRKQYLSKLFEAIYDNPEISQKDLARQFRVSPSRISETVKALRNYKLIEKTGVQLTDAGLRAAATLVDKRPDITFKAFEKAMSGRPEGRSGKAERPPVPRKKNARGTPRGE